MADNKIYRYIGITDTHGKEVNKQVWNNVVLPFMKDYKPDGVIHFGDVGDFDGISHWNRNKKLKIEGKRIKADIEDACSILKDVNNVVPRTCKKVVILGNHDGWVKLYVEEHPELDGVFDLERDFSELGWEVVPENGIYELGKLLCFHGMYTSEFHTKKHLTSFGKNCMYGHMHDHQVFTLSQWSGEHMAQSIGCLCNKGAEYLKGKPTRWVHGFALINYQPSTNLFWASFQKIVNGTYVYNGKKYQ